MKKKKEIGYSGLQKPYMTEYEMAENIVYSANAYMAGLRESGGKVGDYIHDAIQVADEYVSGRRWYEAEIKALTERLQVFIAERADDASR